MRLKTTTRNLLRNYVQRKWEWTLRIIEFDLRVIGGIWKSDNGKEWVLIRERKQGNFNNIQRYSDVSIRRELRRENRWSKQYY